MSTRKKPWWARRRFSCPDCGLIIEDGDCPGGEGMRNGYFDCPRCAVHYSQEEFMKLNQDKWRTDHAAS